MNDFNYASLTHLLELNLREDSDRILYVCTNKLCKKRFLRNNPNLENASVLTVDEIWYDNKLVGLRYKDYKIII